MGKILLAARLALVVALAAAPLVGMPLARAADSAPNASSAPSALDATQTQLKAAVIAVRDKPSERFLERTGPLDAAQTKIFNEEIIPQYSRFIRGYRPVPNSAKVSVEVDEDGIAKYLAFSAKQSLRWTSPKALLVLDVDSSCAQPKCAEAREPVRKLIAARAERRGFGVVWAGAPGAKSEWALGEGIDSSREKTLETWLQEKPLAAVYWMVIKRLPAEDAAHADEAHFQVRLVSWAKEFVASAAAGAAPGANGAAGTDRSDGGASLDPSTATSASTSAATTTVASAAAPGATATSAGSARILKFEDAVELLSEDSFTAAAARLLTDASAQFGQKVAEWSQAGQAATGVAVSTNDPTEGEILVEVSGLKSFADLSRVKSKLQDSFQGSFKDAGGFQERQISAQKVTFGVRSKKGVKELQRSLAGMAVDPGKLSVVGVEDQSIHVELKE